MAYTLDDYRRDYVRGGLHLLTPEERLAGLPAEERLSGLDAEGILAAFSAQNWESLLKAVLSEQRRAQARDES